MQLRKRLKFCRQKCSSNSKVTDVLVACHFEKYDDWDPINLDKRPQQHRLKKLPCAQTADDVMLPALVGRRYADRVSSEHEVQRRMGVPTEILITEYIINIKLSGYRGVYASEVAYVQQIEGHQIGSTALAAVFDFR